MAAQIKFLQPPAFAGKENEDVGDWIYKFERIGRYNRCGDDESRGHVELSLTGAAQKWFTCAEAAGQLSADWRTRNSLTEKLWSLKPVLCDEFLREVGRYQEMTSRTRQED
jgi:hypothetical protein